MKHLPNALSYLKKGLRDVTGTMEHYNNMSSAFGNNTQHGLDAVPGNYNPNSPDIPQSFIDSISQANINRLPDTLNLGFGNFGFKNGQGFPLPTHLPSSGFNQQKHFS